MKLRAGFALTLALALSACGAGNPPAPAVPHSGAGGLNAMPQNPARALAGQALDVAYASNGAVALLQGSAFGTLPVQVIAAVLSGHAPAAGACENGTIAWSNSTGSETDYTIETFADPTCGELAAVWQLSAVPGSPQRSTVSGTVTTYQNGMPIGALALKGSQTLVSASELQFNLQYQSTASGLQTSNGLSCDLRIDSSGQYSTACGFGQVVDATPPEQGATLSLSATPGSQDISVSGTSAGFRGGDVSLNLKPGVFPAWTIEGGSTTGASQFSGRMTYGFSGLEAESFTLTDNAGDAQVSMQSDADADLKGSVTQISTGKTLATFTVLLSNGEGDIGYADGSSASITGWTIIQ